MYRFSSRLPMPLPYIYCMNISLSRLFVTWISTCILCLILNSFSYAQQKYQTITATEGLSQGYVNDIFQDKDGFIWFATKDGLNRYDGYNFKVYMHDNYDPRSISGNAINHITEDSKGRLWICTDNNGISIYDKTKDAFKSIK